MLKEKIDIKVDFYFLILISLKHIADRSYVTLGNRRALEAATIMREIFFFNNITYLYQSMRFSALRNFYWQIKELVDSDERRGLFD